jgi:hypothetical protein
VAGGFTIPVASRTELAMRAVREGWLDVPPGER